MAMSSKEVQAVRTCALVVALVAFIVFLAVAVGSFFGIGYGFLTVAVFLALWAIDLVRAMRKDAKKGGDEDGAR